MMHKKTEQKKDTVIKRQKRVSPASAGRRPSAAAPFWPERQTQRGTGTASRRRHEPEDTQSGSKHVRHRKTSSSQDTSSSRLTIGYICLWIQVT